MKLFIPNALSPDASGLNGSLEAWDMKGKKYTFSGTVHLMR